MAGGGGGAGSTTAIFLPLFETKGGKDRYIEKGRQGNDPQGYSRKGYIFSLQVYERVGFHQLKCIKG